ncbi:MAG TPA: membrane protein insertase YidC [Verrucomicrobiae bacterium]|nr:membrane protein insertase YidC [Verrucomicrobiae bacterium]
MDRKSIPLVAIVVLLLLTAPKIINRVFPPTVVPVSTTQVAAGTNDTSFGTNASAPVFTPGTPAKFVVRDEIPEQLLVISNDNARYTFTSRGGGLQLVELLKYPQSVRSSRLNAKPTNGVATLNTPISPPVLAVLGDESIQGDGVYSLSIITNVNGVRAEKTLPNGLVITKDFVLGSNYLLTAAVRVKNTSKQPVPVPMQQWSAGTSTPMGPQDSGIADSVMWYNGAKQNSVAVSYFNTNTTILGVFHHTVLTEYRAGSNNVVWVSAQNQFFSLATMPASNKLPADLVVHMVLLPPPSEDEIESSSRTVLQPKGLQAYIEYPGATLGPGQEATIEFNIFAGPKVYSTLAALADQLDNHVDLVMGFGFWGAISKALLAVMNWLHYRAGFPYGLAIIFITVVIRSAIWPLTRASTRSMKRMQELQPQIKALQEKYKDDPQKFQQKTWEFYKKNKVNPLGGCLPMVLQIPVFIGFFGMLRSAIELRGAHFLWIGDLSQPDTIFTLPILGHAFPINPMPLIMGASQFWQASMTPVSPGMDPAQQKMMRYLPLMMVYFFYNYSSGLALYWTCSNLITILQNKLTKTKPAAPGTLVPATAGVKKK